jgi:hypothetical protein
MLFLRELFGDPEQVGRRSTVALPELVARRGRPDGELVISGEERDPDKTVFVGNLSLKVPAHQRAARLCWRTIENFEVCIHSAGPRSPINLHLRRGR